MRVGERGVSELSSPAMEWGRDGDCDREEEEEVGRGGTGAEEDSSGAVKSSSEERDTGWGSGLVVRDTLIKGVAEGKYIPKICIYIEVRNGINQLHIHVVCILYLCLYVYTYTMQPLLQSASLSVNILPCTTQ